MENHFSEVKKTSNSFTNELQALELCLEIFLITKNQDVQWLVMVAWSFHPNYCYNRFPYMIVEWKIIFQKSKRPQTHLLVGLNSITIMAWYVFQSPKINR